MKRLLVCSTIVAAALLLVPAAAWAFASPRALPDDALRVAPHSARIGTSVVEKPSLVGAAQLSPSFVLSGTGVVKVNLYDSWSAPQVGAKVAWWVWGATDYGTGNGLTDSSGHVELGGVPAAGTGEGEIVVTPASGDYYYDLWNMSWPAEGTDMGIQPGRQAVTIIAGGDWASYWSNAWVDLYSTEYSTYKYSETVVARDGTTTYATANALPGEITDGAVYFYMNEGRELSTSGLSASPGMDTAWTLNCSQNGAPRIYTSNTSWDSGKPSSAVKLYFKYFPAGWVNDLSGYDADTGKASIWKSSWTSPSKSAASKTLTVPSGAKPGHTYVFTASHRTGPLWLEYPFQVCTLNASDTTPRAGQSIRLSGIVPINGNNPKRVIIYRRSTSAGQPQYFGGPASMAGWTRVGYDYTDGKGYYSKTVKPSRTTWYCVYYPKDNAGHWAAWTSVRKVTVH
jgi:hypothetical protein